jgi:hypothetical protein
MGGSSSVWLLAVSGEHDPVPTMIKVAEAEGQPADLFDHQIDGVGAAVLLHRS